MYISIQAQLLYMLIELYTLCIDPFSMAVSQQTWSLFQEAVGSRQGTAWLGYQPVTFLPTLTQHRKGGTEPGLAIKPTCVKSLIQCATHLPRISIKVIIKDKVLF